MKRHRVNNPVSKRGAKQLSSHSWKRNAVQPKRGRK